MLSTLIAAVALGQQATVPGVTVWVWKLEGDLSKFPIVTEGQTPNAYFVSPQINFEQTFESQEGEISEKFAGEAHGWITVDKAGTYQFQVESDDGGRLWFDEKMVLDIERDAPASNRFVAQTLVDLKEGLTPFRLQFYEDSGNYYTRLKWRKPGDTEWSLVPEANFRTEAGQTFVVSPGVKNFSLVGAATMAGDRRPLDGVHPAYTIENFRGETFEPHVGGLTFMPDGRLAVCTWDPDGAVYLMDLNKSPVEVKRYAVGLGEPLGIAYVDGHLLVTQKGEVTRLIDENGDDVVDRYEVVSAGWPVSHNYHEFSFNLVPWGGKLYITTSVPLRGGWTNYMPGTSGSYAVSGGPGRWIEIDPETGTWRTMARGLRTPNGMNIGVDGKMFVSDNQGSWMPSSRLNVLREGGFYGHQENPDDRVEMDPPVVWLPQNEIGNSPSEPVLVSDGAYRGQMMVGDVTHGGIKRVFVEKVNGVYQGAVFRFSQGIEAGVNRMVWGPDGCLYVGGIGSNGNWHHNNTRFGLQRLRYNGNLPFEMFKVESRKGGLLVTFTEPADPTSLNGVDIEQYHYIQSEFYGGDKQDLERKQPASVTWSDDRTKAFVAIDGLKESHIVYLRWKGLKSADGDDMWSTEAWYTQNELSSVDASGDMKTEPRVPLSPKAPAGADILISESATGLKLVGPGPNRWEKRRGELTVDPSSGDMVSQNKYGDAYFHVEWLSPAGGDPASGLGGNAGVKLMERYEVQILNLPGQPTNGPEVLYKNQAGSAYTFHAPSKNASYGPGVWQTYDIWFRAPKWDGNRKVENARMTMYWNGVLVHDDVEFPNKTGVSVDEAPGQFPILFQAHETDAEGQVKYRNAWVVRDPWAKGITPPNG